MRAPGVALGTARLQEDVYLRALDQGRSRITEKTTCADVVRGRGLIKVLSVRVGTAQLQNHAHLHAFVSAALRLLSLEFVSQGSSQTLEVNGLVKISLGAQTLAVLLVFRAGLPRDHEDGNSRCVTESMKALAKLEARESRHHQIQQDGIRLVLERKSQSLLRVARFDDLIGVRQPHPQQPAYGFIIVHNQNFWHGLGSATSRLACFLCSS